MDFVHQQWHFEIVDNVSGGVDQLQLALVLHDANNLAPPPPACNRFLVSLSLFQELHVSDPKIAKQRLHGRCSMNGLKHIFGGIKNQKPKSSVFIYVTVNTDPGGRAVVFPPGVAFQECQPWGNFTRPTDWERNWVWPSFGVGISHFLPFVSGENPILSDLRVENHLINKWPYS